MTNQRTKGSWDFASDSYGNVKHSKKACVYTNVRETGGDRLVTVAARIPNWADARMIAAAPEMLAALEMFIAWADNTHDTAPAVQHDLAMKAARTAIRKAEGPQ